MDWHYVKDGKGEGPVSAAVMADLERSGVIDGATLVWSDGMAEWQPLSSQRAQLPQPAPAAPVPAAAPAPAAPAAEPESAPAEGQQRCDDCGRWYRPDELFRYKDRSICPNCKPEFLRRLKEGKDPLAALDYASFWQRFGARFVDGIIFNVLSMVMGAVVAIAFKNDPVMRLMPSVLVLLGSAVYEIAMTARYGATLGKMAAKIKVLAEDGSPLTLRQSTLRYFGTLLSGLTCLIGYLIMLNHERRQTLHDRLVGTVVVRA